MWQLSKTISGKHIVRLISASPTGLLLWKHKILTLVNNQLEPIWERTFDDHYYIKDLSSSLLLLQTMNGGSLFIISKQTGQTQSEINGTFYLSASVKTSGGLLIPVKNNEDQYYLMSPDGHLQQTLLPGELPFRLVHGIYAIITYYTSIVCYSMEDGGKVWSIQTNDLQYSTKARIDVPIFISVEQGLLLAVFTTHTAAFDLATGKLIWEHDKGASNQCIVDGDRLILLTALKHLYVLDIATGQPGKNADLEIKNDQKDESISFHNLIEDVTKSIFVQDEKQLYFCLRTAQRIVSVDKKSFSVTNSVSIIADTPGKMFTDELILSEGRLFVTVSYPEVTEVELLIYEQQPS